jgi:hypothetical protein
MSCLFYRETSVEINLELVEAAVQTAVREAVATALARFRAPPPAENSLPRQRRTRPDEIIDWMRDNPGRRAIEIAHGVFGPDAIQPDVYGYLLRLEKNGQVIRDNGRPYRWYVAPG